MKKKILTTFLLCLTVFAATSCASKNASSTETVSPETQQQTESFSETEDESSETESQTESVVQTETTAQTETSSVSDASLSFPFEDFGIDIDIPDDWEITKSDLDAEPPGVSYRCQNIPININFFEYDESLSSVSEAFLGAPLSPLKDDDSYSEFYTGDISVDGKTGRSIMYYYKSAFMNLVSIDTGHSIVYAYIAMPKTGDYGEEIIDNSVYDEFSNTIDNMKFSE